MGIGWKIAIAVMLLFMISRIWPAAKSWMENGPKGSSSDWTMAAILLGGVMFFVWVLTKLV